MPEPIDYRYGRPYGWDTSKDVPKVKDLVVITDENSEYNQRVMRLVEDSAIYMHVTVCDNLISGSGLHVMFKRKDVRVLTSFDEVKVIR